MVSDAREVDAHSPGDLSVGVTRVGARAHEPGEIEGRQRITLLVLGDLVIDVMGLRADDDRDSIEIRLLCSSQPLATEDDAVAAVVGRPADDDRLKDAAQRNVLRELGDLLVGKLGPRVGGVFLETVDRDHQGNAFHSEGVGPARGCGCADDLVSNVRAGTLARLSGHLVDEVELLDV